MEISKTLRKRYYLVEKAKNASIIGEWPVLDGTVPESRYPARHGKRWMAASLPVLHPCGVSRRTGIPAGS